MSTFYFIKSCPTNDEAQYGPKRLLVALVTGWLHIFGERIIDVFSLTLIARAFCMFVTEYSTKGDLNLPRPQSRWNIGGSGYADQLFLANWLSSLLRRCILQNPQSDDRYA